MGKCTPDKMACWKIISFSCRKKGGWISIVYPFRGHLKYSALKGSGCYVYIYHCFILFKSISYNFILFQHSSYTYDYVCQYVQHIELLSWSRFTHLFQLFQILPGPLGVWRWPKTRPQRKRRHGSNVWVDGSIAAVGQPTLTLPKMKLMDATWSKKTVNQLKNGSLWELHSFV
jgi:hypothetical protein